MLLYLGRFGQPVTLYETEPDDEEEWDADTADWDDDPADWDDEEAEPVESAADDDAVKPEART
jgi:hypothetical protein